MEFEFDYISYFRNMGLLLGLVVLMGYLSVRLKKKGFGKWKLTPAHKMGQELQVVETLGLAPHRTLYLIRVHEQEWLIGTTESDIHLIGKVDGAGEKGNVDAHGRMFTEYLKTNQETSD